jgi:hypothetical protein
VTTPLKASPTVADPRGNDHPTPGRSTVTAPSATLTAPTAPARQAVDAPAPQQALAAPHGGTMAPPLPPAPQAPAVARPAATIPAAPRLVRATTHPGLLGPDVLLGPAQAPPSVLDVDPRLLTVQRGPHAAPVPERRPVAPPPDLRGEQREHLRRLLLAAAGVTGGVAVAAASVASALA